MSVAIGGEQVEKFFPERLKKTILCEILISHLSCWLPPGRYCEVKPCLHVEKLGLNTDSFDIHLSVGISFKLTDFQQRTNILK